MPLGCPPAATGSPHARFRLPLPACAGTSGVHLLLSRALVVRAPTLATAAVVAAVLELVAALVVSTPKTLVTTKWAFYAFNRWGERSACTPIASKHGRGWVGAVGWSRARPPTRPPARRPVAAPTSPPPQHLGHAGRQPGGQDAGVLTPAGRVAPVVGLRAVPHGEGGGARGATGRAGASAPTPPRRSRGARPVQSTPFLFMHAMVFRLPLNLHIAVQVVATATLVSSNWDRCSASMTAHGAGELYVRIAARLSRALGVWAPTPSALHGGVVLDPAHPLHGMAACTSLYTFVQLAAACAALHACAALERASRLAFLAKTDAVAEEWALERSCPPRRVAVLEVVLTTALLWFMVDGAATVWLRLQPGAT